MTEALERASVVLVNTNSTDLFTVPSSTGDERALVIGLNLCNVSLSTADLTVSIVSSGGATLSRFAHKEQLAANTRRQLIDGNSKLVLKAGERLRLAASIGNAFEVTASYVLCS
jgi:hypothetical protein